MHIYEAVQEALATGRGITRPVDAFESVVLTPTDVCLVVVVSGERGLYWSPKADDLLADDWIVKEFRVSER